jgi:hypothetical protein
VTPESRATIPISTPVITHTNQELIIPPSHSTIPLVSQSIPAGLSGSRSVTPNGDYSISKFAPLHTTASPQLDTNSYANNLPSSNPLLVNLPPLPVGIVENMNGSHVRIPQPIRTSQVASISVISQRGPGGSQVENTATPLDTRLE